MHIIAEDISAQAKEAAGQYEPSLDMFAPNFERLLIDYSVEYDQYHFDEVVVGAITPIVCDHIHSSQSFPNLFSRQVRRLLAQWNPLEEPALLTDQFRRWRKAFKMSTVPVESSVVDIYGTRTTVKTPQP
jgi:tuftelin-interacting protein 11